MKFRRRFRMPYDSFGSMLDEVSNHPFFHHWKPSRTVEQPRMKPIGLLLLGSLRYLGKGWTFDDLEESTGISEEVHHNFFHIFIEYGRNVLYPHYV